MKKETYVAELDGKTAGFVTLGACRDEDIDESFGEICGIYLAPQWWRKGVGSALVAFAEKELAARGYHEVMLWVLEGNSAARRFYEALGFSLNGGSKEVQLGAALRCVRYRKELPAHLEKNAEIC
ncbi:MAG: GNAT family N-acetyltransferase [Anaerolineales bacterium]|nr:GNAT family N-acetyltransferase [Anaerolineales bacterium]